MSLSNPISQRRAVKQSAGMRPRDFLIRSRFSRWVRRQSEGEVLHIVQLKMPSIFTGRTL